MLNRTKWVALVLLALPLAACSAKVVRQENGWREVESKEAGKTVIEITTDDPQLLATLAKTAPDARVRAEAARRVTDPVVLADIVRSEQDPAIRKKIVERINDDTVLKAIAGSDADEGVRQAATARAEMLKSIDAKHPEFAGWSSCRPGTWVKMRVDVKVNDSKSSVEIVRTLVEARPDKVIFEQKEVASGKGVQGMTRELLTRFDVAYGRKVEDDGDLQVGGKTVRCKWVRYNFQRGGDVAQVRRWLKDEVPGGVIRIDMEVSPEGQPQTWLTASVTGYQRQ